MRNILIIRQSNKSQGCLIYRAKSFADFIKSCVVASSDTFESDLILDIWANLPIYEAQKGGGSLGRVGNKLQRADQVSECFLSGRSERGRRREEAFVAASPVSE